jgi:predicted nucleotidyltransferase component of viral defense system
MIKPGEIQKIANRLGIRDTQIEKDYVIGWVLRGISINTYLKERLIFKSGTSLEKYIFRITDYQRI